MMGPTFSGVINCLGPISTFIHFYLLDSNNCWSCGYCRVYIHLIWPCVNFSNSMMHVVTLYRWQCPACVKFASGHGTTLWWAHDIGFSDWSIQSGRSWLSMELAMGIVWAWVGWSEGLTDGIVRAYIIYNCWPDKYSWAQVAWAWSWSWILCGPEWGDQKVQPTGSSGPEYAQPHHPTSYMIFNLTNTVRPTLGEHEAGHGYCVGPSGVIRRFGQWDCEGPRGMAMESGWWNHLPWARVGRLTS